MRAFAALMFIVVIGSNLVGSQERNELGCGLCEKVQEESSGNEASCVPAMSDSSCAALRRAIDRLRAIVFVEGCTVPCRKYSPEAVCELCKTLVEVGTPLKDQPKDVFISRLRYTCTQFDFLDSVCNVMVDEYGDRLYTLVQQEQSPDAACANLELC